MEIGWRMFHKYSHLFKSEVDIKLKRTLRRTCVLPAMIYSSETWVSSLEVIDELRVNSKSYGEIYDGYKQKKQKRNCRVRERLGHENITRTVSERKREWAGHLVRYTDGRLGKMTSRYPRDRTGTEGKPRDRQDDETGKISGGVTRMSVAQQRTQQTSMLIRQYATSMLIHN